jgi:hypothetical protein
MTNDANVTMTAGVYIINGGSFSVGGAVHVPPIWRKAGFPMPRSMPLTLLSQPLPRAAVHPVQSRKWRSEAASDSMCFTIRSPSQPATLPLAIRRDPCKATLRPYRVVISSIGTRLVPEGFMYPSEQIDGW